MDKHEIGERITQLRLIKNVSEYQLSLELGRSKSYIQNITSGKALPSINGLFDICDYFNITIDEFFCLEDKEILENKRISDLINKLDRNCINSTIALLEILRDNLL